MRSRLNVIYLTLAHQSDWLVGLFFLAIAVLAYLPILNDYPVADDFGHIMKLSDIRFYEFWKFFTIQTPTFLRPVPFYAIWLIIHFFDMEWLPSHLLNAIMNGMTAFFLFKLLGTLTLRRSTSLIAAMLFVLSPLAPEAVSWTAGRFDVWALLFIILTLYLYALFMKSGSRSAYVGSLVTAAVALLSKESAMIIVIIIPALEIMVRPALETDYETKHKAGSNGMAQTSKRLAPFIVMFASYLVLRVLVLGVLFRSTNYMDISGIPNIEAPLRTLLTLAAPLDQYVTSKNLILLVSAYTCTLFAISFILVIARWKNAPAMARRLWLFMIVCFAASLIPVYTAFFVTGMGFYLNNSRFFYITNLFLLSLLVICL